jgi:hypothetical protein
MCIGINDDGQTPQEMEHVTADFSQIGGRRRIQTTKIVPDTLTLLRTIRHAAGARS